MKKLHFEENIQAPPQQVWKALWEDRNYRNWTSVFAEGSYAVSDWKEGSRIEFLSPSGEGMHSIIEKKKENEFMSFKHLGAIRDGKDVPPDQDSESWAGAHENYTLKNDGNKTTLLVDVDITPDHEKYFNEAFPKALERVKTLAEETEKVAK